MILENHKLSHLDHIYFCNLKKTFLFETKKCNQYGTISRSGCPRLQPKIAIMIMPIIAKTNNKQHNISLQFLACFGPCCKSLSVGSPM